MDDFSKWLQWVWLPFLALIGAGIEWIRRSNNEHRAAIASLESKMSDRQQRHEVQVQQSLAEAARAFSSAVSALHEKANQIRAEVQEQRVHAAETFVSHERHDREIDKLQGDIKGLTRSVAEVRSAAGKQ